MNPVAAAVAVTRVNVEVLESFLMTNKFQGLVGFIMISIVFIAEGDMTYLYTY